MNLKIKIVTGFRNDQAHTIDIDEAHKAYYLFEHPTERGVFNGGLAIRGQDIQTIVPDYAATMGWNPAYQLMSEDWTEIKQLGVDRRMQSLMGRAKDIAQLKDPTDLNTPLTELVQKKYPELAAPKNEEV